jgi:LEA14-like dessication related protein
MCPSLALILVLPWLALLLTGCASVEPPTVAATGGELVGITTDGMTLGVDLAVTNPNSIDLPVRGVSYQLAAEGVNVAKGSAALADGESLPAGGTKALRVPIELRWDELLEAGDALSASGGDFGYRVNGSASFATPGTAGLLPVKVPFEYEGQLPLRQALSNPRLLTSPDARRLAAELFGRLLGG